MHKKILFILLSLLTLSVLFTGCRTSKKKEKAQETTTEQEKVYKFDTTSDSYINSLGFDITKYVKLPADYDKMTINLNGQANVTDEKLKEYINRMIEDTPIYEKTGETVIKEGDIVQVDFTEQIEGQENYTEEKYMYRLGNDVFPKKDVDDQLIGKKVGDKHTFVYTYTKEDATEELVGKKATLVIKILDIYKATPMNYDNLTDKYVVEQFGNYYDNIKTVDDFKNEMKKGLETELKNGKQDLIRDTYAQLLLDNSKVKLPKNALKKQKENEILYLEDYMSHEGYKGSIKDFLKKNLGMTEKEYFDEMEKNLKIKYIKDAIIKDKNFAISSEQFDEEVKLFMNSDGFTNPEDVYDTFGGKEAAMLHFAEERILDEMLKTCTVVE